MASSTMDKTEEDKCDKNEGSKQLLYSDVFGQGYQEDKLRIIGKTKTQDHLQTFSIPKSTVLSQIKSFLPRLSDANVKMAEDIENNPDRADEINIECVDHDTESKHIEMNISMIPDAGGEILDESESDESCDDDDDSDTEEHSTNIDCNETHQHVSKENGNTNEQKDLIKLKLPSSRKTGRNQKAHIEEIDGSTVT